jgi:hypothetical protein
VIFFLLCFLIVAMIFLKSKNLPPLNREVFSFASISIHVNIIWVEKIVQQKYNTEQRHYKNIRSHNSTGLISQQGKFKSSRSPPGRLVQLPMAKLYTKLYCHSWNSIHKSEVRTHKRINATSRVTRWQRPRRDPTHPTSGSNQLPWPPPAAQFRTQQLHEEYQAA